MRPARLAPAMISTLGHRVPRRRQRGAPPALAPFGRDRPWSRKSGLQRSRRRDRTHGANDRICVPGRTPNCGGRRDSL